MTCFERARAILEKNRQALEDAARALLERETLDEAAIRALAAGLHPVEAAAAPAQGG